MSAIAQDTPISAFLEKWDNSKAYLFKVIDLMPEDQFDFKPTAKQMSFRQQLLHIRNNIEWLATSYFSEEEFNRSKLETDATTKEEILALLENAFEKVKVLIQKTSSNALKDKVNFFAGPKTKLQILNLLQDHLTHHRGQLIVYLNLNNIDPPSYVGW